MEKQASTKTPPLQQQQQQLTPQEWETLIDDFSSGDPFRRLRWLPLPLLDLALHSLLRRDFPLPLKPSLLLFIEESLPLPSAVAALPPLLDALRSLLLLTSPDPFPLPLKEQSMVTFTSLAISALDSPLPLPDAPHLSALTELLLAVANRPNHGPDRHARAVACECLRELEAAHPRLLSEITGHLWSLAQAERTHASQSYLLLLATVVSNIVRHGLLSSPTVSVLSTTSPLVPFTAPESLSSPLSPNPDDCSPSDLNLREIRRVMAFLLERPQALTPPATLQLVSILTGIAGALEHHVPAVAALLKVQFSGLLYSYDPLLCHVVLMLYSRFSDAFVGDDERGIARRLALITREAHYPVVFRLLALHWLLGSPGLNCAEASLAPLASCFYPAVFDPLSLKAKKLDVLARVAAHADAEEKRRKQEGKETMVVKLFEDGLVCVSAFKWLPPWSTETLVTLRTLHMFLISVAPHQNKSLKDPGIVNSLVESTIFCNIQDMLIKLTLEHRGLVPVVAAFVDRLLGCKAHRMVGDRLLQTFDEQLLPKLESDYQLAYYFPIFERIAKNDTIPPRSLLELLTRYMISLVEKHGPDTGLRSWSQGNKVLGICHMMLKHHHSSRIFVPMSHLLGFTCQFFPDLEVRDTARIYLRMLLCIPGKKLRHTLSTAEELKGVSPSPHTGTFLQAPSPRPSRDRKKSSGVSAYIHLERVIPLLVKQSWSLSVPNLGGNGESNYFAGIGDTIIPPSKDSEREAEAEVSFDRISYPGEPLRVMDSKVAEILSVLRRHFACIPDYRHMPGAKITIPCILKFESEPFSRVWGGDLSSTGSDELDGLPALYATTITFSTISNYGPIPPCRVPFLLGEPLQTGLDIVPVQNYLEEDTSFRASVAIELEPREPRPGLIDVAIKANAENGQIISGSLQSITVGIEDMFLKATVPDDIMVDEYAEYYSNLYHALWEACGSSSNTGREIFYLSGGKGIAAISGTRSVKLLEVFSDSLISAVERYLAPFVVSVVGEPLMNAVKINGVIRDVIWGVDSGSISDENIDALVPYTENVPLQLPYYDHDLSDEVNLPDISKRSMGIFLVLIFLPPRFHLLFQMEVGEVSTLVRIRTDHWPCLAYVDEYLELLSSIEKE